MPVPPPWRENDEGPGWINDITEEVVFDHPLKRVIDRKRAEAESSESALAVDGVVEAKDDGQAIVPVQMPASGSTQLVPIDNENARKLTRSSNKASRGKYSDYRCLWKEKSRGQNEEGK